MALMNSELVRLKYELGYNALNVGAEPYIGVAAIFEQVIQPYLQSGASATSSTSIASATSSTLATLTLDSATGFNVGDAVIVDVDAFQERATIRSITGSAIQVFLQKAHAGTYPVTVEGGEAIVRSILQRLQALAGLGAQNGEGGAMGTAVGTAGVKKVEEIEFFGGATASASQMSELIRQRDYWRDELASVLGIVRLNGGLAGGGGTEVSMY